LGHILGPFSCGHGLQGNVAPSTEAPSLLLQRVVPPIHERVLVKFMTPPSRLRSSLSVSSPAPSTSKRAP
jgi:hypothetical protein